jgi:hypothetical protein
MSKKDISKHCYFSTEEKADDFLFESFEGLFIHAVNNKKVILPEPQFPLTAFLLKFNVWIAKEKGWEYGNEEQYKKLLSLKNLKECLNYKEKEIEAPAIAYFCNLIHKSKLMPELSNANAQNACKSICARYGLKYTVRVSKAFRRGELEKGRQENQFKEILKMVDCETRQAIESYLQGKRTK